MHTPDTALETLTLLWNNYVDLAERHDVEWMSSEDVERHVSNATPLRPLRISSWLARQGFIISAWSLGEFYALERCVAFGVMPLKKRNESTVTWIGRRLKEVWPLAPDLDLAWFEFAGALRNLIAHSGGRVESPRGRALLGRSQEAFPGIRLLEDKYVALEHEHVAVVKWKIETFIRRTRGLPGLSSANAHQDRDDSLVAQDVSQGNG